MMYADSYQTTVGSAFITKPIETAIKQAIIKDSIDKVSLNVNHDGHFKPVFITGVYPSESEIPLFTHPITILNFNHQNYLCTDLRLYVRKDVELGNIEAGIKNLTEYNFVKSRAVLSMLWLNDESSYIKNSLSFAGMVYAAWLSEVISNAFALDFKDRTVIAVLTSFYYQTLFDNERVFDDQYKEKLAVHTIKATKAPAEFVFTVLDRVETLTSVSDLCQAITNISESIRLKNMNLAVLLTLIKNSWYGTNVKEILAVSLEHPPTWIAIVYACLSERTYKNSMIYRIAERLGKRGVADEFMTNYRSLIEDQLVRAHEEITIRDFE